MRDYRFFKLTQEPKLFGVSVLSAIPLGLFTLIGLVWGEALPMMIAGAVVGGFIHIKFGVKGIRYFYGYLYWYLPRWITKLFLPNSPDSSNRTYRR